MQTARTYAASSRVLHTVVGRLHAILLFQNRASLTSELTSDPDCARSSPRNEADSDAERRYPPAGDGFRMGEDGLQLDE